MRLQTGRVETRGIRAEALEMRYWSGDTGTEVLEWRHWNGGTEAETLKRRHMHRRWEKTTAPGISPERSVKQTSEYVE